MAIKKDKCPTGYTLNAKGECVLKTPSNKLSPLNTTPPQIIKKNNKVAVNEVPKTTAMSKEEFRDKKKAAKQAKKIEDLRSGSPSRAGRIIKDIVVTAAGAAAAGAGFKKLFQKDTRSQQQNSNDMKKGGVVKSKKKQIKVKTIKKK